MATTIEIRGTEIALLALEGTPRQVSWAESIRADRIQYAEGQIGSTLAAAKAFGVDMTSAYVLAEIERMEHGLRATAMQRTAAAWWIEHRAADLTDLLAASTR